MGFDSRQVWHNRTKTGSTARRVVVGWLLLRGLGEDLIQGGGLREGVRAQVGWM